MNLNHHLLITFANFTVIVEMQHELDSVYDLLLDYMTR